MPATGINDLLGVGIALITALAWATSTIIIKMIVAKIDIFTLNTIRLWVGSLLLLMIIGISGRAGALINTPLVPFLLVASSGVIAMAVGDTLYMKSLSLIDASKAFTIAQCSFPIMATIVAVVVLGEAFTWLTAAGAVLVVCGIYLIAAKDKRTPDLIPTQTGAPHGVAFALAAATAWTAATISIKIGTVAMDAIVAAGIRIPVAATVLTLLMCSRRQGTVIRPPKHEPRTLAMVVVAGVLTYGVAAVGYVTAIQMIGAAKTVLVTTTAPILVLPFSIIFLKERPGGTTVAGVLSCIVGICCVAL